MQQLRLSTTSRAASVRVVANLSPMGPLGKPAAKPADRVRAGAAPHSMPAPPPPGAASRPHQPLPSVVDGEGQSPEYIAACMREHLDARQHQALATGIDPTTYARVRQLLPGVKYQARARCLIAKSEDGALMRLPGTVGLAAAGDADAAAVDLARILLQHMGAFVISKEGLGDAAALAAAAPALAVCDVVIAVAGADLALPSAIAGVVDAPILAAPAEAGATIEAAPRGAAPVAVTPADGGATAALMAARMLRTSAVRAVQIAEAAAAAAASPGAAAAEAGESAAHSTAN